MKLISDISILIDILAIFSLITGLIFNSKNNVDPKKKASLGIFIGISMTLYLLILGITILVGIINHNFLYLSLLIFIILPFIIGHFSSYSKVKLYTFYQILSYLGSLSILIFTRLH